MLDRQQILRLIPHQGASCLLDAMLSWSADGILCNARSHLDQGNPLRRAGQLGTICGAEYGLQAAALHGALLGGGEVQRAGYLVSLRDVAIGTERLDDAAHGTLEIEAKRVRQDAGSLIYEFRLVSEAGRCLLSGRAAIVLNDG